MRWRREEGGGGGGVVDGLCSTGSDGHKYIGECVCVLLKFVCVCIVIRGKAYNRTEIDADPDKEFDFNKKYLYTIKVDKVIAVSFLRVHALHRMMEAINKLIGLFL